MATIKEIAEIVGVSSAAVSRVLNYDEGFLSVRKRGRQFLPRLKKWDIKRESFFPK